MSISPFCAERYELAVPARTNPPARIVLEPLPAGSAAVLGEAFAALEPWSKYPYPAGVLAAYFADSKECRPRFLVRVGAAMAGAVVLQTNWLRGPYLQFLGILPDYRGCRIGSAFMDWLEAEARGAGDRNLWVCVSDFNTRAVAFYERHGFHSVAWLPDLVREGIGEVLMRKPLGNNR